MEGSCKLRILCAHFLWNSTIIQLMSFCRVFSTNSTPFVKYRNSRSYTTMSLEDNQFRITAHDNYKPRRMAFWNSLLPSLMTSDPEACSSSRGTRNSVVLDIVFSLTLLYHMHV